MTEKTVEGRDAVAGQVDRPVGREYPKRDNLALWGNLLMAHVWGAATWVRPGWIPASFATVSIVIAGLILYEDRIALRAERKSA